MKIIFKHGEVDIVKAHRAAIQCAGKYKDFHSGEVGAEAIANYILPRESNQFEGYLRFPLAQNSEDDRTRNELHIYFSPRAFQPYRITFVHLALDGTLGFDVYDQEWSQKVAAQLMATGVVKREIEKAYFGNEST
jgi:hypothetical protein